MSDSNRSLVARNDFIRRVVTASKIPADKSTELATELWKLPELADNWDGLTTGCG
ncbi:hypothetical protein M0R72_00795 [Candidatus Pacearchaeota archaeon]|jgi:hypothetical protein|nr:hypothetical protein [Candidatus Pacearchaeota archaeon]